MVPACSYLLLFAAAHSTGGLSWSVHVWTGVTFLAGLTGLLLTCLVIARDRDLREVLQTIFSREVH